MKINFEGTVEEYERVFLGACPGDCQEECEEEEEIEPPFTITFERLNDKIRNRYLFD